MVKCDYRMIRTKRFLYKYMRNTGMKISRHVLLSRSLIGRALDSGSSLCASESCRDSIIRGSSEVQNVVLLYGRFAT